MLARVIPTEPAVDITPEEMLTYVQEKSQWCKALGTFLDGSVAIKSTGQDIAQAWKKKEASISILLEDWIESEKWIMALATNTVFFLNFSVFLFEAD